MRTQYYRVTVIETNEIAGQTVRGRVVASRHRTLRAAREWSEGRWHGSPPAGSKIVHDDGTVYDVV